jgi:hypothetical protein
MGGHDRLILNESLITFVEPLCDTDYGAIATGFLLSYFAVYNAMKLWKVVHSLNSASKLMKRSVKLYTVAACSLFVLAHLATFQVGAPAATFYKILEFGYCVSLWVSA